jgi:cyclopropane-fatty-acyl-phospholipid synthase
MFTKQMMHQVFALANGTPFAVTYWDRTTERFGQGKPLFTLIFRDEQVLDLFQQDIEVGFGDAYMQGRVDVEGDLADVVALASETLHSRQGSPADGLLRLMGRVAKRMGKRSHRQQKHDVGHHYDLGNAFFQLWLDPSLSYSCAYFRSPDDTLAAAQRQKINHSLRKLRLYPTEMLLDIGCGWGALVRHAAQEYGVQTLGITLSEEQYAYSCQAIEEAGLQEQADVRLAHYQTLAREGRQFDKIASIGMIEHVGKAHLPEFAQAVASLLRPGGLALLHCITTPQEGPFNAWLTKHIFPGAYLPTVPELLGHLAAQNLRILDVENLRPHYRLTLDHWSERFEQHTPEIQEQFGEEFVRMWRLYLRSSSACFREGSVEVHQMLVSKGKTDIVPMTRDDLCICSVS